MDLVGALVRLRAPRAEDAPAMVAALADPQVVRWLGAWSRRPYSPADAEAHLREPDPGGIEWGIECLEDGAFIGVTGLRRLDTRNRNCWWGIWIGPPSRWGHGYGTEACRLVTRFAFEQLGMEKVYLQVQEGDDRGRRACQGAGYVVEGVLPRHRWHEGRLITTFLMAAHRERP